MENKTSAKAYKIGNLTFKTINDLAKYLGVGISVARRYVGQLKTDDGRVIRILTVVN